MPDSAPVNAGVLVSSFCVQNSAMSESEYGRRFPKSINANHQDEVPSLPADCTSFGSNSACEVSGFFSPSSAQAAADVRIFRVQSHPEWVKQSFLAVWAKQERKGAISKDEGERLRKSQEVGGTGQ